MRRISWLAEASLSFCLAFLFWQFQWGSLLRAEARTGSAAPWLSLWSFLTGTEDCPVLGQFVDFPSAFGD